jgi:acetyltransferase-like isoleucine patch superfamily enzyme
VLTDHVSNLLFVSTEKAVDMDRSKESFGKFKGVTVKKRGSIGANAKILPGKVIEEDGCGSGRKCCD